MHVYEIQVLDSDWFSVASGVNRTQNVKRLDKTIGIYRYRSGMYRLVAFVGIGKLQYRFKACFGSHR